MKRSLAIVLWSHLQDSVSRPDIVYQEITIEMKVADPSAAGMVNLTPFDGTIGTPDQRQLEFPIVLPHPGMLPKLCFENVTGSAFHIVRSMAGVESPPPWRCQAAYKRRHIGSHRFWSSVLAQRGHRLLRLAKLLQQHHGFQPFLRLPQLLLHLLWDSRMLHQPPVRCLRWMISLVDTRSLPVLGLQFE